MPWADQQMELTSRRYTSDVTSNLADPKRQWSIEAKPIVLPPAVSLPVKGGLRGRVRCQRSHEAEKDDAEWLNERQLSRNGRPVPASLLLGLRAEE